MTATTATKSARAAAAALCVKAGFLDEGDGVYTSRDGGNGTDCVADPATLRAATALVTQIRALGLSATRDVCDEWVSVIIAP